MGLFGKRPTRDLEERVFALERKVEGFKLDLADAMDRVVSLHGRLSARIKAEKRGDGEVEAPHGFSPHMPNTDPVSARILARRQKSLAAMVAPKPTDEEE